MRDFIKLIFNQRFRKVVGLFVIFFLQFWWLNKIKRFLSAEKQEIKYKQLYTRQGKMFTDRAIQFGGLLIKLGQFFSARVDILPKEYTEELSELQDAVTPVSTNKIIDRIEREFSRPLKEIYRYFNPEPIAAASLGQVHEAELINGEKVAVKVLRPGIEEVISIDLEALKVVTLFAKRVEKIKNIAALDEVYDEFWDTVNDELDYVKEAKNADEFRENFANDERIYIPQIHWELTTKKVITMEFIEGIKINEYELIDEQKVNKSALAETILSSYLVQFLVNGFFHADPHPGNILVNKEGKLVFLDFGMVGRVDNHMKENMIELIMGLVKNDPGAVVQSFDDLGFLKPHADRSTLLKGVRLILDRFYGDVKSIDFEEFSQELREFIYSQPFQLPARTVFLGKALNTLIGICFGLDKDFNLVKVATPYINQMFGSEEKGGINLILDQAKSTLVELISVPSKISRLVDGLESGNLKMHVNKGFEQRLFEHQTFLSERIIRAIISSGFLVAGTQLLGRFYYLGITMVVIGGLSGVFLLRKPKRKYPKRNMPVSGGPGFKRPQIHP